MPNPRKLECYLNNETLNDLIVSHLHRIGVIRDYEEVKNLCLSEPQEGLRKLSITFDRDEQVIFHP